MSSYITAEELKAQLTLTGTSFADGEVERAVASASRGIERVCRRRFTLDTEAVTRRYTPVPGELVEINDVPDTTEAVVSVFGVEWTADTDFVWEPLNAVPDGFPYTYLSLLRRLPDSNSGYTAAVKVTAKFGWSEVPDNIKTATGIVASKLVIRLRQAPFGIVTAGIDRGVAMRIARTDPDVAWLLEGYQRRDRFQAAKLG